ncbi:hypothetical protein EP7_000994 [Isosphaeraceae bacterium EP7]
MVAAAMMGVTLGIPTHIKRVIKVEEDFDASNKVRGVVSMNDDTNSPATDADLADQWAAERCPLIDGIVFGDGRVKHVLAAWKKQENGRLGLVVETGEWTTLKDFRRKGSLDWTEIMELCTTEDPARGIRILGGAGGLGGDGFVAALRTDSGEISWIAFFTASNPFEVVQIRGDFVMARTNLGMWWRFPLDAPDRVTLQ